MRSFLDAPGLAKALARKNGVRQYVTQEFLALFEEKTRQLSGRFRSALELEDIQSEVILWALEGNLQGYQPQKGPVWGYAYPALVNWLAPQASPLNAPMVRQRDTDSTVAAKRAAQSNMASADWEDLVGGDYRYEPLHELLQQEIRNACPVSFEILEGIRPPRDLGKPGERKKQVLQELQACYPDRETQLIKQAADILAGLRGSRGKYRQKDNGGSPKK
jgi:hypothetical protein